MELSVKTLSVTKLSGPVGPMQIENPKADTEEQIVDSTCSFNDNTQMDQAKFKKKLLANRTQRQECKSDSPKEMIQAKSSHPESRQIL